MVVVHCSVADFSAAAVVAVLVARELTAVAHCSVADFYCFAVAAEEAVAAVVG